jgi:Fe-S-cluster containining protein
MPGAPSSPPLPQVRRDLRWGTQPIANAVEPRLLVEDPRFARRLAPRARDAELLLSLREGTGSLDALLDASGLSPDDAYRRLWALARDLYFEVDALPAYDRLFKGAPGSKKSPGAPKVTPGQAFLCSGCGRCCAHTDIGPISGAEVSRIAAIVEGFEEQCVQVGGTDPEAEPLFVLASSSKDCPYLQEDGRCAIHAEHGAEAKPEVCRQFPYRFTILSGQDSGQDSGQGSNEIPRSVVTIESECWDIERSLADGEASMARAAAGTKAEAQLDLDRVWAMGPVLETVPEQRFLDPFTPLDPGSWEELRAGLARTLAEDVEPVDALASLLQSLDAGREPPAFLDEDRWSARYPGRFGRVSLGQIDWLSETLARMVERWAAEGQAWRSRLLPVLLTGVEALGTDTEVSVPPGEARRLITRSILTQFESENVLKKDNLEYGIVFLYWRMRIARGALSGNSSVRIRCFCAAWPSQAKADFGERRPTVEVFFLVPLFAPWR